MHVQSGCSGNDNDVVILSLPCSDKTVWNYKNTVSGNFQKSEINTYTWNFDMYDTSSDR